MASRVCSVSCPFFIGDPADSLTLSEINNALFLAIVEYPIYELRVNLLPVFKRYPKELLLLSQLLWRVHECMLHGSVSQTRFFHINAHCFWWDHSTS